MATTKKNTIILLGQPVYNEDGVAQETISPGHLVDGVTAILKNASADADAPRAFALERGELGKGTVTNPDTNAGSADYASGDTVKVGVFSPGQHVLALVASGQTISVNDRLASAGDGTLKKYSSGTMLARSLETLGAVTSLTAIRVEIM